MIINITGQAGSGKTTIAKELKKRIPSAIVIDGDDLRKLFSNQDYSEDGRRRNISLAYSIARFLESANTVPIIALISPYLDLREELKSVTEVKEIYLATSQVRGRETFFAQGYVAPQENFLFVNTDDSLDQCLTDILRYLSLNNEEKS